MSEKPVLDRVSYIEFYVGSARQWAYFHKKAMGFAIVGYAGPETGVRDRVSYIVQHGKVRIIFTSFIEPNSDIGRHFVTHGDGVRDISIGVPDLDAALEDITRRGIIKPGKAMDRKTGNGLIRTSALPTYGETVHTLLDTSEYSEDLPPGFEHIEEEKDAGMIGRIDHIVGNVEDKKMDDWVNYYIKGMGFDQLISFDDKDISTQYSALRSKVVHYNNRKIVFPINEPALGLKKSQIQEYIDYYKSAGVQHIALHTENIIDTVKRMKENGVEFLSTPDTYYVDLKDRVGPIFEDMEKLKELGILVDRDDTGYILQIFTKPIGDRPTFFYEIIQRRGGTSFGKGNFKALFESIEREQARRGNL
ncbi:MAG: 4-hydroxyphenylpyruvate dioxygenase [Candidatus Thermoplasmatota archaeon]|nr:4-hydroxyphenylpyruvate dioxygenase [Candidatus Thermoplasmatota archaeon]